VSYAFVETGDRDLEPPFGTAGDDDDSEFEFGGLSNGEEELHNLDSEELDVLSSSSKTSESSSSQDESSQDLGINECPESLSFVGSDAPLKILKGLSYFSAQGWLRS
jgi:hypothetical protein